MHEILAKLSWPKRGAAEILGRFWTNKVVQGYEVQLETYKKAESTTRATYLLIDVGQMGAKYKRIRAIRSAALKRGQPASEIALVDGKRQSSASKRDRK